MRSPTAKQLVHQRQRIKNNIEKQANKSSREGAVAFEDLGIDAIMVDEIHEFKKPPIATKMRLRGLNTGTSDRSIALKFLTSYVKKNNNGNGVYLFSGTPGDQHAQRNFQHVALLMDDTLKRSGIESWDTWFNTFADATNDAEMTDTGEYEPIKRLAAFDNVDELVRLMSEFTDVVQAKEMPEFVDRTTPSGKTLRSPDLTPEERDFPGKRLRTPEPDRAALRCCVISDVGEMTPAQVPILGTHPLARAGVQATPAESSDTIGGQEGNERIPIRTGTSMANASLDPRLYDPDAPDEPDNKIHRVVRNVLKHYQEDGAGQAIFVDKG